MPDVNDLIEEAERADDFLLDMERLHRRRLRRSIGKLEDRIVGLSQRLETTASGRLEGIKINLKQAQQVHKDVVNAFAKEYGVTTESIVGDFDEISTFIQGSYKNLDEVVKYTGVDRDMINQLKAQSLTDYENIGLSSQNRIANAMYDSVIAQAPYNDLVKTFKGVLKGGVDVRGTPMEVHAETHAFDAVMNFHNQVNLKKAEDLGINHYLYFGDIIKTSRSFCITRAGKTYTRGQIASWNKLDWQGKRGPAFEFRGGWRCRHHWQPVRPEWLTEGEDGEFGETTPDEVFAQSQRRDFPEVDNAVSNKEVMKKQHDKSQDKSKGLKAERGKLKGKKATPATKERLNEITKTLNVEKALRRDLKAEIAAIKGDVGKQGRKIKKDVRAGRKPKALTKKELHPKKPVTVHDDLLEETGIREVSDNSAFRSYDSFDRQVVAPIQAETERMLDFGNGKLRELLEVGDRPKDVVIQAFNGGSLPGAGERLGAHNINVAGGRIRIASFEDALTKKAGDAASTLDVGGWQVNSSVRGAYRHEYGHHVHKVLLEEADQIRWDKVFDGSSDSWWRSNVSNYAGTNVREAFAESFSAYIHPKYKKGLLPKGIEGYFDKLLKKKAKVAKKAVKKAVASTRKLKSTPTSFKGWNDVSEIKPDMLKKYNMNVGVTSYKSEAQMLNDWNHIGGEVARLQKESKLVRATLKKKPMEKLTLQGSGNLQGAPRRAVGVYDPSKKTLRLVTNKLEWESGFKVGRDAYATTTDTLGTLRHEYGHHVYNSNPAVKKGWIDLSRRNSAEFRKISKYANVSASEAFSESFGAYLHPEYGSKGLPRLPRVIEEFLERIN